MNLSPVMYKFGEYRFAVVPLSQASSFFDKGWLVSECPPNWAVGFYSPKFSATKRGQWLFCSLAKRLTLLSLVMEKVPLEVKDNA
jgi:hypothetical protein